MTELVIPAFVGAFILGIAGGTWYIVGALMWFVGWYWYCASVLVLQTYATACLKGVR